MCYLNIKTASAYEQKNLSTAATVGHPRRARGPLHCRENRDEPATRRAAKCASPVGSGLVPPHSTQSPSCSHVQAAGSCGTTRIDNLPNAIAAGYAQSHCFGKARVNAGSNVFGGGQRPSSILQARRTSSETISVYRRRCKIDPSEIRQLGSLTLFYH
jgi:hypothetical protein